MIFLEAPSANKNELCTNMPIPFGEWLAERIAMRGLNAHQFSKKIKKSPAHVSNLLKGDVGVSPELLHVIAKELELPPGEVFRAWAESASGEEIPPYSGPVPLRDGVEILIDLRDGKFRGTVTEQSLRVLREVSKPAEN